MIKRLKAAHLYLKSEFRLHIDDESQCGDHCMQFALSSTPCTHAHNSTCQSCNLIREFWQILTWQYNKDLITGSFTVVHFDYYSVQKSYYSEISFSVIDTIIMVVYMHGSKGHIFYPIL